MKKALLQALLPCGKAVLRLRIPARFFWMKSVNSLRIFRSNCCVYSRKEHLSESGGMRSVSVDVRIIAATNKQLLKEIKEGRFREDLFYRLNVLNITLPPLRDRREDIRLLVDFFIRKYADERGSTAPVTGVDHDVARILYDYSWPGNVRELENVIERAMILCPGGNIQVSDLPKHFKHQATQTLDLGEIPASAKLTDTLVMVEKLLILRALKLSGNVQTRAAEILGIGKSGLNQKIKKFDIDIGSKE